MGIKVFSFFFRHVREKRNRSSLVIMSEDTLSQRREYEPEDTPRLLLEHAHVTK